MADFDYIEINASAEQLEKIARMEIEDKIINENSSDNSLPTTKLVYKTIENLIPKVTTKGSIVSVNDVFSIEHNLDVKLTSDTISDFSSVNVTRAGKNLLLYPYSHTTNTVNGITFTDNGDGTVTANGTATANADFYLQYSFNIIKGMIVSSGTVGDSSSTYEVFVNGFDGTILHSYGGNGYANHDFTANIFIRVRPNTTVNNLVFKPQLEFNTVATEYEPYNTQTVTANADGTVEGLTSLSPVMTLYTNNANVIINLTYNRDTNKPLKFEKVYEGVVQNVTFDKPYTELYVNYQTVMGWGADAGGYLDNGYGTWAYFDGAEHIWYHFKYDGFCAWENVQANGRINSAEFSLGANGITNFLISPMGEVDNTTDTLTIYAK